MRTTIRTKSITALENVLDTLIWRQLAWLTCPAGRQCAPVHVLYLVQVATGSRCVACELCIQIRTVLLRVRVLKVLAKVLGRRVRAARHAPNTAEYRGRLERWRREGALAVDLHDEKRDLEGGVDLGVGEQIAPDDALFDEVFGLRERSGLVLGLVGGLAHIEGFARGFWRGGLGCGGLFARMCSLLLLRLLLLLCRLCSASSTQPARSAHTKAMVITQNGLALLHVLRQVEGQAAQCDLLITAAGDGRTAVNGREFLDDLELDKTFGERVVFIDGNAYGDELVVVILYAMVCDG